MRTPPRTYTVHATPASRFLGGIVQALPLSVTRKRKHQFIKASRDHGSKKKCITGSWDLNIPSEILQEILSRLGLKDNIRASVVYKRWREAAVTVRKSQPQPWLFYRQSGPEEEDSPAGSPYILVDTSRSQTYKLNFPELSKSDRFSYSRDGWLLVIKYYPSVLLLLNPFTREHIYLPNMPVNKVVAFSAAPTSSSCLVISLDQLSFNSSLLIKTWQPDATAWTTYSFTNQPGHEWERCLFSNGMFYCLSTCGYLGVFDPSRATWNVLPVKPCPAKFDEPMLMTEHEGDIFVMNTFGYPPVFKLNLERKIWEEKRELGGLTIFQSSHVSLTRAGLSVEEKNRMYDQHGLYYSLDDRKHGFFYSLGGGKNDFFWHSSSRSRNIAWVDPPHSSNLRVVT